MLTIATCDTQDKSLPCSKSLSVDCTLSQWSHCSTTCGLGIQARNVEKEAQNGGKECDGPLSKECNLKKCPGKLKKAYLWRFHEDISNHELKAS